MRASKTSASVEIPRDRKRWAGIGVEVTAALALCRFVRDGAALSLWGHCLYTAALVPQALRTSLDVRCGRLRGAAALLAAAAILVLLPVQSAALGDGWPDALNPEMLHALLFETTIGTAWLAQAAVAVLLLASSRVPLPWRDRAVASASALLLASLTLTGHAAMHESWLGIVHRANHLLHLLSAGFWLGALVPLLPTLRALGEPSRRKDATTALHRFSIAGHVAVALVFATGSLNTALILQRWPTQWSSPYQALLALKIVLVTIMAALAIFNRYVVVPRMRTAPESALAALRTATVLELGLGAAAIACVSVFGLLEPT